MQCKGFKTTAKLSVKTHLRLMNLPSAGKSQRLALHGLQAGAQRVGRALVSDGDAVTCGSQTSLGKNAGCALASPGFCSYITCVCSYLITEQIFIGELLHNFSLCSVIFCLPQGTFSMQCQQDWTGHWVEQFSGCEMQYLGTPP